MNVLDSNVVSELMRAQPAPQVMAHIDALRPENTYITAVTMAEIRFGLACLPPGRRRAQLAGAAEVLFTQVLAGVLGFDADCTVAYGDICAQRRQSGRPIATADATIAAICRSRRAALLTRNESDFEATGVVVVNPWSAELDERG